MTTPKPKPTINIRPASLSEYKEIGRIAAATYYDKALTRFLNPHAEKYYSHYQRGFTQRCLQRMLDPRNLSFVAYNVATGEIVGYTQIVRLGEDEGARRQIASRKSVWLWVLSWLWPIWCAVLGWVVGGDKSLNQEALKMFVRNEELDEVKYWKGFEERANRWYVQSCVVRDQWQGLGIGKRLVGEAIKRADEEGVVVSLESSEEGEWMYRSVGFELLGRFDQDTWGESLGSGGGVMIWTPKGWKGEKKVVK